MSDKLTVLFAGLKELAEELITSIQQSGSDNRVNDMAIGLLLKIVETEQRCKQLQINDVESRGGQSSASDGSMPIATIKNATDTLKEVSKVRDRIKNWARPERQYQKNVRILNTYLKLAENGGKVTVDALRRAYGDDPEFLRNYPQMKNISPKNHGKIFDEDGGAVMLWEPVREYVEEYKEKRSF